MNRLSLEVEGGYLGNCLIITDNETNKSIKLLALQLMKIIKSSRFCGSLFYGGWDKDGEQITVYHDDRENHEVTFTVEELEELL